MQQEVGQLCLLLPLPTAWESQLRLSGPALSIASPPVKGLVTLPQARFLFSLEVPFLLAEAQAACHPFLVGSCLYLVDDFLFPTKFSEVSDT